MHQPRLPLPLRIAAVAHGAAIIWIYPLLDAAGDERAFFLPAAATLAFTPFVAWGLARIKRAAWIALYAELALMLSIAAATFRYTEHAPFLLEASAHVLLTALAFLPRNMRAPYVHGVRRGFRTHKRWDINLRSVLDADGTRREAETMDLSQAGAYVGVHTGGLTLNQRVMIEVHLRGGRSLRLPAHIMSLNPEDLDTKPEGVGIQFSHLTPHDKEALDKFIEEGRRHVRTPVRVPVNFESHGEYVRCETYDLSVSGCYLETPRSVLSPGDQLALTLHLHEGDRLDLVGEVSWLPESERDSKPEGIAIEFRALSRGDEARLKDRLAEANFVGDGD